MTATKEQGGRTKLWIGMEGTGEVKMNFIDRFSKNSLDYVACKRCAAVAVAIHYNPACVSYNNSNNNKVEKTAPFRSLLQILQLDPSTPTSPPSVVARIPIDDGDIVDMEVAATSIRGQEEEEEEVLVLTEKSLWKITTRRRQ